MPEPAYSFPERLEGHHLQQLHNLYQGEWWTRGRSLSDINRMVEHSDFVFAICSEPGAQLVAFARVLTDRVFKAFIFDVIVAPDHRDEGLGRRLMDRILQHPELERVKHVELYCLPEMVPFYKKWGFSLDVS